MAKPQPPAEGEQKAPATFRECQIQLEENGIAIRKVFEEYQVKHDTDTWDKAYFTGDLNDAFVTGMQMSKTKKEETK